MTTSEVFYHRHFLPGWLLHGRAGDAGSGETAAIDIRKLHDEQIPDVNGHKLPARITAGQINSRTRNSEPRLIGARGLGVTNASQTRGFQSVRKAKKLKMLFGCLQGFDPDMLIQRQEIYDFRVNSSCLAGLRDSAKKFAGPTNIYVVFAPFRFEIL